MENIEIPTKFLALIPVVVLIIKYLRVVPAIEKIKSYLPLVSMGIAIGLAYIVGGAIEVWYEPILPGIAIGLMAAGGYDTLKSATSTPKI